MRIGIGAAMAIALTACDPPPPAPPTTIGAPPTTLAAPPTTIAAPPTTIAPPTPTLAAPSTSTAPSAEVDHATDASPNEADHAHHRHHHAPVRVHERDTDWDGGAVVGPDSW